MIEDYFLRKGNPIQRLDIWVKVLLLLIAVPLVAFTGSKYTFLGTVFLLFLIIVLCKIKVYKIWIAAKIYYLITFITLILLSLIFNQGNLIIRLFVGIQFALRFFLAITSGVLFSIVVDPLEIPQGFSQVHLPHRYGVAIMVASRMMPLISKNLSNTIDIQRTRGMEFSFSFKKISKLQLILMSIFIPTIYSALEASTSLSDTLLARGYDPSQKITTPPNHINFLDLFVVIISIIILILTVLGI